MAPDRVRSDVCAISRAARARLSSRRDTRLRVYFTNNPPAPSRDKSFLEFYLVIEFPCAWALGVT